MRRDAVIGAIAVERDRQDDIKGPLIVRPDTDWYAILGEEYGEVGKEITRGIPPRAKPVDVEKLKTELVQVAAVCVAWLETL